MIKYLMQSIHVFKIKTHQERADARRGEEIGKKNRNRKGDFFAATKIHVLAKKKGNLNMEVRSSTNAAKEFLQTT
jgi:hypothetical protein